MPQLARITVERQARGDPRIGPSSSVGEVSCLCLKGKDSLLGSGVHVHGMGVVTCMFISDGGKSEYTQLCCGAVLSSAASAVVEMPRLETLLQF